jgi:hypothetical protein
MNVRLFSGVLAAVSIAPAVDDDALERVPSELTQKYGPADGQFSAKCVQEQSRTVYANGTPVDVPLPPRKLEGAGSSWSKVPGLFISYSPFDPDENCSKGLIRVELAGYHKLKLDAAVRARAQDAKM